MKLACFLVPGLRITLEDKRTGSKKDPVQFMSRGGLKDLVNDLVGERGKVTDVISLSGIDTFEEKVPVDGKMKMVERECTVDVALRWVDGFESNIITFVNTIPTAEGGTHLSGFEKSMNRAVNDVLLKDCLLYTSPSPRDQRGSRMPSSA